MDVREAAEHDYEAVMRLLSQLNPADPQPERSVGESVYTRIIDSDYLTLVVAEMDSRVVGTCYLNVIPNLTRTAAPYALVENVVTDEDHRGRGVGKAVVSYAVSLAWAAGCYKVMLMTGRGSEAVFRFYRECGFSGEEKRAFIQRAT